MNNRERFISALSFGEPDRVPLEPGYPRESTLAVWHQQGLPKDVHWYDYLMAILGITRQPATPTADLGVDFRMIPQFEEKVLSHQDGHILVQDWMGAVTEISDQYDYTYIRTAKDFVTRKWHRFPVQTEQDWENSILWRYEIGTAGRFTEGFYESLLSLSQRTDPLKLALNGPFWQLREWCGFEGLCTLMIENPGFVEAMADYWRDFVSRLLSQILQSIIPDYVLINEDMAYKQHSMISPRMIDRFLMPSWDEWVRLLKDHGVPLVFIDSDGFVGELIPLWLEAGFDGTTPLEVAAGNDIVAFRKLYGSQFAFEGGIDKRALAQGGNSLSEEVKRVVPPLLDKGGYIPGCDHGVPPDISWGNYVAFSRLLAEYCGWL